MNFCSRSPLRKYIEQKISFSDSKYVLKLLSHPQYHQKCHLNRFFSANIGQTESNCLKVFESLESFETFRKDLFFNHPKQSVGFVPTMGALHPGHMSLFKYARKQNDIVVASVFVNPTQFGPNEDYDRYPRVPEADCALLENAGVDAVIMPSKDQMYKENHCVYVIPEGFDDLPEGGHRPGHFRGVATVVAKLLNLVRPHRSYFGQKDALQCVLIRRLVEDLHLPGEVVICPTVREEDGLAMSSRNAYLSPEERQAGTILYKALSSMKQHWEDQILKDKNAGVNATLLHGIGMEILRSEPLVSSIDYLSVGSKDSMQELVEVTGKGAIISVALRIGSVRLIDNMIL